MIANLAVLVQPCRPRPVGWIECDRVAAVALGEPGGDAVDERVHTLPRDCGDRHHVLVPRGIVQQLLAALVVEQIAGLIARRIECWRKPGDTVATGEKYGIIYFGSQAAVHFPEGSLCTVKPGDRVAGGLTPIGEWTRKL